MRLCCRLNKNGSGIIPSTPLAKHTPLTTNQSIDVSLPLKPLGPVMNMEPLNNLQVAVKNNRRLLYPTPCAFCTWQQNGKLGLPCNMEEYSQ